MSSLIRDIPPTNKDYLTSDGRPMAETDVHRILMNDLINTLDVFKVLRPPAMRASWNACSNKPRETDLLD